MAIGLLGSAEYAAHYGAAPPTRIWSMDSIQTPLHRAPDSGGKAAYLDALAHGLSRADAFVSFRNHWSTVGPSGIDRRAARNDRALIPHPP